MAQKEVYNPGPGPRYKTDDGFEAELTGWRDRRTGEWYDVQAGEPMPHGRDWKEIDLVTINLQPDSEKGFYRSFVLEVDGFDEVYGITDLIESAAEDYGFIR